jgi:hypothetical protein
MATILDALSSISAYPISPRAIERVAEVRGLGVYSEFTATLSNTAQYNLAEADLYEWLAEAPDVAQGGQTYSFTDEQREFFKHRALLLREKWGAVAQAKSTIYGYKGSRL